MTEPVMSGRFSLYQTPEGGVHIAYKADGDDTETRHVEIPGFIAKAAKAAAEGKLNPIQMAKVMMGHAPEAGDIRDGAAGSEPASGMGVHS